MRLTWCDLGESNLKRVPGGPVPSQDRPSDAVGPARLPHVHSTQPLELQRSHPTDGQRNQDVQVRFLDRKLGHPLDEGLQFLFASGFDGDSVVRDPVDLFESMYGYMRMENTYHVGLRQFVQLVGNESAALLTNRRQSGQFGRNSMAWDWGIQPNLFDNDVILEQRLRSLDAQFQLVLVAERLEESLVLLRHLLCWPVETVTHLVINQRKRDKIVALTAAERQRLRKWLRVDYLLYDHYVQLLDDKVL